MDEYKKAKQTNTWEKPKQTVHVNTNYDYDKEITATPSSGHVVTVNNLRLQYRLSTVSPMTTRRHQACSHIRLSKRSSRDTTHQRESTGYWIQRITFETNAADTHNVYLLHSPSGGEGNNVVSSN